MKFKIIPLEERIVLDAALAAHIVDSYHFEHQLDRVGVTTPNDITTNSHDTLMVDHTGAEASANRVVVISSHIKDANILAQASLDSTKIVMYDPSSTSLKDLANKIESALNGSKADSIAFVNEGNANSFKLTDHTLISADSLNKDSSLQDFWHNIGRLMKSDGQVDLLIAGTNAIQAQANSSLIHELGSLIGTRNQAGIHLASTQDLLNHSDTADALSLSGLKSWSDSLSSTEANSTGTAPLHLLLVDSDANNSATLAQAAASDVKVIYYNSHTTLQQLSDKIAVTLNGAKADSIAFANEGSADSIKLTSDITMTADNLRSNVDLQTFWRNVGSMIKDGGRIDLLACDVASTDAGKALVSELDTLVDSGSHQVSVAASTDRTANAAQSGDWTLEIGNIDARSVYFNAALLDKWTGQLGLSSQDLNPGSASSNPQDFVQMGNKVFFVATTAGSGTELFSKDLTTGAVSVVKEIGVINTTDYTPSSNPANLTVVNGTLYFTATDSTHGNELWKTDGTAAGTVMVADITSGSGSTTFSDLYNANGTLYFVVNGNQLWRSSGDSASTVKVQQFSSDSPVFNLVAQNGNIYFTASDGTVDIFGLNNLQVPRVTLWMSQIGSSSAQAVVTQSGIFGSNPIPYYVDNIVSYNGTLYFTAEVPIFNGTTASLASTLFKSNGIPQGTAGSSYGVVYQTISTDHFNFDNVIEQNGSIFFTGTAPDTHRASLFVTNGTTSTILKDFYNGGFGAMDLVTTSDGLVYFVAQDSATTAGIWRTDGSPGGTVLLKEFSYNLSSGINPPANLTALGNTVFFSANDGVNGTELWQTDGTVAGTTLYNNINPTGDSNPNNLLALSNGLLFAANNGTTGNELYQIVGSQANNDSYSVNQNPPLLPGLPPEFTLTTTAATGVLANDTGGGTVSLVSGPSYGSLTLNSDGSFTYIPTPGNWFVTDSFVYKITDGSFTSTATATINLIGNSAPTTASDSYTVSYNQPLTVGNGSSDPNGTLYGAQGILLNDTDIDRDASQPLFYPLSALLISGPQHGTLTINYQRTDGSNQLFNGAFVYTPDPNYSGTDSFVYKAFDGMNYSAEQTVTLNVVNNPPSFNVNNTDIYAAQNSGYQTISNWITNISPGAGETGPTSFTVTTSNPSFFTVLPTISVHGTSADIFYQLDPYVTGDQAVTITVSDGSLTYSQVLTWHVGNINDAPIGTSITKTILEDHSYTISAADFGFTDPHDNPSNNFLAVKITTLPTNGTLTDNGIAVTAGQMISVTDINNGKLVFTPASNANGTGYANFTFQVQDDGGLGNGSGGADLDPTAKTFTFNVTAVNDAPTGTDITKAILEDNPYTFSAGDFGFSDSLDGNNLSVVKITTLPTNGNLTDNRIAVTTGQLISITDINNGKLVFTPAANANGTGYANFTFQVQDDGGTDNGGQNLDLSPKTFTFDVTSVNDAPSGTDISKTIPQDAPYAIKASDFGFSDPNDSPQNTLLAVKITTLPATGTLMDNGVTVIAGQFISVADINSGLLIYTPPAGTAGSNLANFTFQVQDNGSTANGGIDVDQTPHTFTFNVSAVNSAPVGENKVVSTNEDTILNGQLNFSDINGDPINATITQGTAHGQLTLNNNGTFTYTPNTDYNGSDSFSYKLNDGTVDSPIYTVTINVASVNDAPTSINVTKTISEDTSYTISAVDFGFNDPKDAPANNLLAVKIASLPTNGILTDNGVAVTAGQMISIADINAGKLIFTPAANANGNGYASFTFQVQDDGGTGNGGIDLSTNSNTFTINVTSVNDAPIGSNVTKTILEGGSYTISAADLGFSDPFDSPANNLLAIRITTLPIVGTLMDNGVAVTAGQFISIVDINSGKLIYTSPTYGYGLNLANFAFQVQDDGGTANGGINLSSTSNTFTFNVTHVDHAPVANNDSFSLNQGSSLTINAPGIMANDTDIDGDALLASIVSGPSHGTITFNANGSFNYTPTSNYSGTDTFTYKVNDGQLDSNIATVTLTVNPMVTNHAPVANHDSYNDFYKTGGSANIVINALNGILANDTDLDPGTTLTAQLVSGPAHGTLRLNADGSFSYTANAGYSGTDSFTYKASDGKLLSNAATVSIVVDAKPILSLDGTSSKIYTEKKLPIILSNAAKVSDADAKDYAGAKLTVNISNNGTATDILSIVATNKIKVIGSNVYESGVLIGSYTGGTNNSPLIITFNANALAQDVQEVIKQIGFSNSSNTPSTLNRTVNFVITDAQGAQSDVQSKIVKVLAVNDPAQVQFKDQTISVIRHTQTNIGISSMAGLSLTDIDGTSTSLYSITLQVNKGTLNFTSLTGLNGLVLFDTPNSLGLRTITMAGTRDQLNLALSRLTYTSAYGYIGQDKLTITAVDTGFSLGNSISNIFQYSSGYFLLDQKFVNITVK